MTENTFDTFISSVDSKKAEAYFHSVDLYTLIEEAKDHFPVAINFIFLLCRPELSKAFYQYFLGSNQAYWKRRIDLGDDKIFVAEAYNAIPKALEAFNAYAFNSDEEVVKQLKICIYRRAGQQVAFKILRDRLKQKFVSPVERETDNNSLTKNYDEYLDARDSIATSTQFTKDLVIQDTFSRFIVTLKQEYPKYADIIVKKQQGLSNEEIAEELNITQWIIKKTLYNVHTLWNKFIGE